MTMNAVSMHNVTFKNIRENANADQDILETRLKFADEMLSVKQTAIVLATCSVFTITDADVLQNISDKWTIVTEQVQIVPLQILVYIIMNAYTLVLIMDSAFVQEVLD